nr:hypothetical protein [Tanacetum cinerariifolium]
TLKNSVSKAKVQPPVLTRIKHAVDVEPIVPRLRNNRDVHLDYLRHLKDSVETICNIVEEAKVLKYQNLKDCIGNNPPTPDKNTPDFDSVFVIGKMPASLQGKENAIRQLKKQLSKLKKQVTVAKPSSKSDSTTHQHVVTVKSQKTNVPVPPSTGVTSYPKASGSQPKSNIKTNRISPAKGANKLPVEDLPRMNKSHLRTTNRVDSSSRLKR